MKRAVTRHDQMNKEPRIVVILMLHFKLRYLCVLLATLNLSVIVKYTTSILTLSVKNVVS